MVDVISYWLVILDTCLNGAKIQKQRHETDGKWEIRVPDLERRSFGDRLGGVHRKTFCTRT